MTDFNKGDTVEWTEAWNTGTKMFRGEVVEVGEVTKGSSLAGDKRTVAAFDFEFEDADRDITSFDAEHFEDKDVTVNPSDD